MGAVPEILSRSCADPRRLPRHSELGWRTPAERFDGTPFIDRGFASVPSLAAIADLLDAILAA
jgi:hypothetical protein